MLTYTVARGGLGATPIYACAADGSGFVKCSANDAPTAQTMTALRAAIQAAAVAVGELGSGIGSGSASSTNVIGEFPDLRALMEVIGKVDFTKNQTLFDLKTLADYYWDPNGHPSAESRAWVTKQLHWMLDNAGVLITVMQEVAAGKYGGLKPAVPVKITPITPPAPSAALSTGKKVGLAAAAVGGLLLLGLFVRSSMKLKDAPTTF